LNLPRSLIDSPGPRPHDHAADVCGLPLMRRTDRDVMLAAEWPGWLRGPAESSVTYSSNQARLDGDRRLDAARS
jgi:hypothetical protein